MTIPRAILLVLLLALGGWQCCGGPTPELEDEPETPFCPLPPCPFEATSMQAWADACWEPGTCQRVECPHDDGNHYVCARSP